MRGCCGVPIRIFASIEARSICFRECEREPRIFPLTVLEERRRRWMRRSIRGRVARPTLSVTNDERTLSHCRLTALTRCTGGGGGGGNVRNPTRVPRMRADSRRIGSEENGIFRRLLSSPSTTTSTLFQFQFL